MKRRILLLAALLPLCTLAFAQMLESDDGNRFQWGRDSTHTQKTDVPVGMYQWTISPLLGEIVPQAEVDTLMQDFQNFNNHDGNRGTYNHTGVHGSPRLSRLYMERPVETGRYLFLEAYDYFRPDLSTFRFSNTKSPITNLSYHRAGSSSQGNDRVKAYYANNINKLAGFGFQLDYLYSRGLYVNQQNSMFNGTVYGYYHGDRYQMHAWTSSNHSKMSENGGIVEDEYITHPENYERSFNTRDIPTQLTETWNRNHDQTYYLSHRFNLGYNKRMELPDSLMPHIASDEELLKAAFKDSMLAAIKADSVRLAVTLDTLRAKAEAELEYPEEFVPVASIIHTFEARKMKHNYSGRRVTLNSDFYGFDHGEGDYMDDLSLGLSFTNTVALSMREGFRKWVKFSLTAFATHDHTKYMLPDSMSYIENNVSVGGSIARTSGSLLHFNGTGQVTLVGECVGDFNIDGKADLNFRVLRDTCSLEAHAFFRGDKPNFFMRHYHSRFAWWDNDYDKILRTRIEGTFRLKKVGTQLRFGIENITSPTVFATTLKPNAEDGGIAYSHTVAPVQYSGSLQVLSAIVRQDLHSKHVHWENELAYQKSSNDNVLPLPALNYWTNLYFSFSVARVLNIHIGADMRYFTRYKAPDYSPVMNSFTTQDREYSMDIGGYPIVNAYVNAHLKHFRAYLNLEHLNGSFMQGNSFLVPHYPIDPFTIHFGISWNFFN